MWAEISPRLNWRGYLWTVLIIMVWTAFSFLEAALWEW